MYCVEETTEQGRGSEINNRLSVSRNKTEESQGHRGSPEGHRKECAGSVCLHPVPSQSSEGNLIFHFSMIPVALLLMNSFITSDLCLNGILPMTVRDGRGHKDTEFSA